MKLVGLMTVRNEEWVLGLSLRAALLFLDEVVVLDHASTDGTAGLVERIAAEHPGRVRLLWEDDPVWHEAAIRQRLLEAGREAGATHLCVVDADEVLTGNLLAEIRGLFAALVPGETLSLPWLTLWRSLEAYRDDSTRLSQRWMVLGFRDADGVHYAPEPRGFDFHTRHPRGVAGDRRCGTGRASGGMLHLSAVNWRRVQVKAAWYWMLEEARFPWRRTPAERDAMYYATYLDETDVRTVEVPASWWQPYLAWRSKVDLSSPGWHERECRRMLEEYGADRFSGLDRWGAAGEAAATARAAAEERGR